MREQQIRNMSEELDRDGFVHCKQVLSGDLLALAQEAVESNLKKPSPMAANYGDKTNPEGYFFHDFNNWRRIKQIEALFRHDSIVSLLQDLTRSQKLWFFHDHVLVKGGQGPGTPWHHDRPYYLVDGPKNVSIWIALTAIKKNHCLEFLRGSHKIAKLFMPAKFENGSAMESKEGFEILNDSALQSYATSEPVCFEMEAGDAVVFNHKTIHRAPANDSNRVRIALSLRYLCDGATLTKKVVNATPPFDRMGLKFSEGDPIPENWFPRVY